MKLMGNNILLKFLLRQARKQIKKVKRFNRFLVAGDMNIGDAIIVSSGAAALRKIFPNAEIDLVTKKSMEYLLEGNPGISNLYPIYVGTPFPTENDLFELSKLADSKEYDLIINFSPMVADKIFGKKNIINFSLMAAELVKNENIEYSINNISFQTYKFIGDIFRDFVPNGFGNSFKGPNIYLSDDTIEHARSFLLNHGVPFDYPIIMFNPETSSKFTRIPSDIQINLLKRLTDFQCTVLLGAEHIERNIGQNLLNSLPPEKREKIILVPAVLKLDVYTALIDLVDIYITGDTGPLHLAAARKFSRGNGNSLRNKTAIFSVFGSTPSRIYGYDSKTPGFFAANQDAPSRVFVAGSPCRNITCINKSAKTCSKVRCFQSLDLNKIVSEAADYIETIRKYHSENSMVFMQSIQQFSL
jgi:ADP-heptose:LPS heptosyltransferase